MTKWQKGPGAATPKALKSNHQHDSTTPRLALPDAKTTGIVQIRFRNDAGRLDWSLVARGASFPEVIAAVVEADRLLREHFGQKAVA